MLHKGYDNFLVAGRVIKYMLPTENELPSLNPTVEPSSEETTQFDQAEDEEKTSFRSYCFKDVGEYTSFFVSF